MIRSFIGKDGSAAFTGGVYNHSKTAWNVLRNGSEERLKEK
jgi:hypothetical protein